MDSPPGAPTSGTIARSPARKSAAGSPTGAAKFTNFNSKMKKISKSDFCQIFDKRPKGSSINCNLTYEILQFIPLHEKIKIWGRNLPFLQLFCRNFYHFYQQ